MNLYKKKNIFISIVCCCLLLSSCSSKGEDEDVSTEVVKTDFFVETSLGEEFSGESFLKKTWRVSAKQDIEITANANARIWDITVKTGENVRIGRQLAKLEDNLWNFWINLQRGNNNIQRAQINYESQKIALDKQIFDAEINLENLQRSLATLRADSEKSIILAQDSVKNSQDVWNIEKLDIQIEKLDIQIEKLTNSIQQARLDYDIRIKSDQQTIDSFIANTQSQIRNIELVLNDSIEFGDQLLWVTEFNWRNNDEFDDYLWVNASTQKNAARILLTQLIGIEESDILSQYWEDLKQSTLDEDEFQEVLDNIESIYVDIEVFLNDLEITINNSITSIWSLSQAQLDAFSNSVNGLQSQLQWSFSGFTSFTVNIETFLATYRDNQDSLLRSINLQEQDIDVLQKDIKSLAKDRDILQRNIDSGELSAETGLERTKISIDDNIASLQTQIKAAWNTLSNAIKNKEVTLRSLQNAIEDARISYAASAKDFSKLTVESPINGIISEILVDEWQEVFSGTPLFQVVSNAAPEVEISFSSGERSLIREWQEVFVTIGDERLRGSISSISDIADENLNYKATVVFTSGTTLIGNLVSVEIPTETGKMLIPLNIITTQWWEIGTVKTLSGATFSDVRVRMGEVFWEYVEIVSCAKNCVDLNIVTNDISNYDENKFKIVEK